MRRLSKLVPRTELDAARKELSLLQACLNRIANDEPFATEHVKLADGGKYVLRLYGPERAEGGIVHELFRRKGQRDCVTVHFYEDISRFWLAETFTGPDTTAIKIAYERLGVAVETARGREQAVGR